MINVYPKEKLGGSDHGWLNTRHHFSFADYQDISRMGMGNLRVINDDTIKPGTGFDFHPHKDMEIITYVTQGAITHEDSEGNKGRTVAGDVQIMSAGTGIYHSEYNKENTDTKLYQIWIKPKVKGIEPRWETKEMPRNEKGFQLLLDGSGNAPLKINQDAEIYVAHFSAGERIVKNLSNNAYILIISGDVSVDDIPAKSGDGIEVISQLSVEVFAKTESEVLLIQA